MYWICNNHTRKEFYTDSEQEAMFWAGMVEYTVINRHNCTHVMV